MFEIALFGLAVFIASRIWRRLERQEHAIFQLRARLEALERRPPAVGGADLITSAPPQVRSTPSPVAPPVARPEPPPVFAGAVNQSNPTPVVPPVVRPEPAQGFGGPDLVGSAPPRGTAAAQAPAAAMSAESIETAIGSRWLLYVGVVAVIVGISYFEKLAVDNQWIGEGARVLQGGAAGLLLVYAGLRFIRGGYPIYGQMIAGGGIAVQYVSIYAAFNFYHLIDRPLAFTLLMLVTMLAASFADRQRSQGLALMAVGGGFATPFLLPGATDAQLALFGYDAILIAGTMYLAHRRDWPMLNVVSYGLTVLTVFGWGTRFYAPSKYLITELFLTLFCAMYLYILSQSRKPERSNADLSSLLWTAPVAYYLASIAILSSHPAGMLVYLLGLALAGAFLSVRVTGRANPGVRLVFWAATAGPLVQWTTRYAGDVWFAPGLATVTAVYLIQLVAHLEATRRTDRRLSPVELAVLHATGLGAFVCAYRLIDAVNVDAVGSAAALFAAWQGAVWFRLAPRDRDHALHFGALGFTLLMIAIGLQFHGAWITMGWAAEGAVIIWLGLRERRDWLRAGGLVLLAVSALRLFDLQFAPRSLDQSVLLNQPVACSLVVIALMYGLAWLHHRRNETGQYSIEIGGALVAAQLLTLSMATAEIEAYWQSATTGIWWMARNGPQAMAWAATGVAIVWLGLVRRQLWMRALGGALVAIAMALIVLFDFAAVPLTHVVVANSRVIAGAVVIALLYGLARLYRELGEPGRAAHQVYAALVLAANVLMLLLLTSEATAYWRVRDALNARDLGAVEGQFAREMTLSITWALYATALIVAGIRKQYAPIRYLAIAIFAVTIGKVFAFDLPKLGEIYRVLSIIGLGVTLLVSSYLYHRFRSRLSQQAE